MYVLYIYRSLQGQFQHDNYRSSKARLCKQCNQGVLAKALSHSIRGKKKTAQSDEDNDDGDERTRCLYYARSLKRLPQRQLWNVADHGRIRLRRRREGTQKCRKASKEAGSRCRWKSPPADTVGTVTMGLHSKHMSLLWRGYCRNRRWRSGEVSITLEVKRSYMRGQRA